MYVGYHGICGARINQSGEVLDTREIVISNAPGSKGKPSIASDGTNYLAVWENEHNGNSNIYGARISQSGIVLDSGCIAISTIPDLGRNPSVAFDGTNYLVVWRNESLYQLYGARVTPAGEVLDPGGIAFPTASDCQYNLSIAFDGTNYLVVGGGFNIYGVRITPAGEVLDQAGIPISITGDWVNHPSVAFDGTNYLVVWKSDDQSGDGHYDVHGAKISPEGEVIDSFVVSLQKGYQEFPAVAGGNGKFLITYSGWTPEINGKPANTMRIWGKFYPFTGVEEKERFRVESLELRIFPNPFNKKAMINYQLPAKGRVSLKIYDLAGRLVKALVDKEVKTGKHTIKWDGKDLQGRKVSSGIYFCKMEAGDFKAIKKLVILK